MNIELICNYSKINKIFKKISFSKKKIQLLIFSLFSYLSVYFKKDHKCNDKEIIKQKKEKEKKT